jgi:uncharacterized protein (TIGR00290 family)
MAMNNKILFAWSGGKDSAMALFDVKKKRDLEISALMTTVTGEYNRISMHGVREKLLKRQAVSLGFPLEIVRISQKASIGECEDTMRELLIRYKELGVYSVAFGDIFLDDLKKYREDNLSQIDMKGIFPIWKRDTQQLAREFIKSGFQAIITCVDTKVLGEHFVGREFDEAFLSELPESIDPCGENGEFHSFVYGGPIFRDKICFEKGEVVLREDRFLFCDLVPV